MRITSSQFGSYIREFVFLLAGAFLCAILLVTFVHISGVNRNSKAGFQEMLNGTAYKPYVYRALVPLSVRGILGILPASLEVNLRKQLTESPTIRRWLTVFNVAAELGLEALLVWGIMYFSLLGFCYSFRYLLSTVGGLKSPVSLDLFSLLALFPLLLFFGFGYIYDFTTLFLFTIGLACMACRKWHVYLPIFFLACLNKETTILLTLVFFVHYQERKRMLRPRFLTLLTLQFASYVLVKSWLFFRYQTNSGESVEIHLAEYQMVLQQHPWVGIASLTLFLIILLLVFYRWRQKPLFLRHATVMFPPLLVLTIPFGFPYEFRVFYEIYPVFSSLVILSMARYCKVIVMLYTL